VGETYRIVPRYPSSPKVRRGLSLDRNGTHFAWVKDESRALIEAHVLAGSRVECTVVERGERWEAFQYGKWKEWTLGVGICELVEQLEIKSEPE
jgi:hypothetical protein